MINYTVTWYNPGSTTPSTTTINANTFICENELVVFIDNTNHRVLALALGLNPMVSVTPTP